MPRKPKPGAEAMKHPLLAAAVGMLPAAGTVWEEHQRIAWFDLMRKAVAMTYELPASSITVGGSVVAGVSSAASTAKYYIQPDGTAVADGKMIDANQIPHGTVVLDYRPTSAAGRWDDKDDPIMWLTHGAQIVRPPPGVKLRPADGPLPAAPSANGRGEAEA